MKNFTTATVSLGLMLAIAVTGLGLISFDIVTNQPVQAVANVLLSVVLGFVGSHLSSAQGAAQALTTPPQFEAQVIRVPVPVSAPAPAPISAPFATQNTTTTATAVVADSITGENI